MSHNYHEIEELSDRPLLLTNEQLVSDTNIVRAYEVVLRGNIGRAGANLYIFARTVRCETGAVIDLSGANGADATAVAPVALNPGDPGSPGANAPSGKKGGDFLISAVEMVGSLTVVSRGGSGGQGGHGGDGAPGKHGDDLDNNTQFTSAQTGGQGGKGGTGGPAGVSGDAGDGGIVMVFTMTKTTPAAVEVDLSAGTEGKAGQVGSYGIGGKGGSGGRWGASEEQSGHHTDGGYVWKWRGNGIQGKQGDHGDPAPSPKPGRKGNGGAVTIDEASWFTVAIGFIGRGTDRPFQELLAAVEETYLNDKLEMAYNLAAFLTMIAQLTQSEIDAAVAMDLSGVEDPGLFGFIEVIRLMLLLTKPWTETLSSSRAVQDRARILAEQIKHGLNYFGHSPNWVGRLDFEAIKTDVRQALEDADIIESAKTAADKEFAKQQSKIAAIDAAIGKSKILEKQNQDELKQIGATLTAVKAVIQDLAAQQEVAKEEIINAKSAFEEAAQLAGGCGIIQIVEVVAAIVSVVTSAGTTVTAIAAAATATGAAAGAVEDHGLALKNLDTTVKAFDLVSTDVSKVAEAIKKIYGSYQGLANLLKSNQDSARIVIEEDQFDKLYEKFDEEFGKVDVPADVKERFRNSIGRFVDIVKARNRMILQHDGLIIRQDALEREIEAHQVEQDRFEDTRAEDLVAEVAARRYSGLMERLWRDQMRRSREMVWLCERAYELWSLRECPNFCVRGVSGPVHDWALRPYP